jgi:putative component of membrane protein insertase Oxa1/YidC/SpoIIIJ protein YidD
MQTSDSPMKSIALAAIALYRRHLSPRKGVSCAYRVHTGRDSCSAYGQRVIERFGLRAGLALLRRRMAACGAQYWRHRPQQTQGTAPPRRPTPRPGVQAGFCDLPCEIPNCELPNCEPPFGQALELCADCAPCDWPFHRRKRDRDRYVDIRPNSGPF